MLLEVGIHLLNDQAAACGVLPGRTHAAEHELIQHPAQVPKQRQLVHEDVCQQWPQAQHSVAARAAREGFGPALSARHDVVYCKPHLRSLESRSRQVTRRPPRMQLGHSLWVECFHTQRVLCDS